VAIRQLLAQSHPLVAVAVEIGAIQAQPLEQLAAQAVPAVAELLMAVRSQPALAIRQAHHLRRAAPEVMELKSLEIQREVVAAAHLLWVLPQHLEQAVRAVMEPHQLFLDHL
jgi:hypothetical protein